MPKKQLPQKTENGKVIPFRGDPSRVVALPCGFHETSTTEYNTRSPTVTKKYTIKLKSGSGGAAAGLGHLAFLSAAERQIRTQDKEGA